MARKQRWRPTLKQTIGVVLAGMILVTAAVLTVTSYTTTRRSLLQFSRDLIAQNAVLVREQVHGFLRPAKSASALALELVKSGLVEVDDPRSVERYFFNFLSVQENVAMLNYGDRDGNFIMVKRQADRSLSTKIVTIGDDGSRSVLWRHRDLNGPLEPPREAVVDPEDQYDPRTRPWYQGAVSDRTLHWTGVYIFHTDRQPGVTAAIPRFDDQGEVLGVLSVDVGLVQMSHFLREHIRVGKSGQAFLLDEESRLIAVKDVDSLTMADPAAGATGERLRHISESPVAEIAAIANTAVCRDYFTRAFTGAGDEAGHTVRYQVGDRDFVATLIPIEVGENRRWIAGVVALEDEFLASAKEANLRALITAVIFAFIALVVGIVLARIIARSLTVLVTESARVRNLDIDSGSKDSHFREVDEVLRAFEGMKTGLRAFQKYVPFKLVRTLLEQEEDPSLGGEQRTLTIFFSDIRAFTTISEDMEPMTLAQNLGEYMSTVTRRIIERQGTVDKYIGDAVMAFWGAPQSVPDHARQACFAACEALADARDLETGNVDHPSFFTRVGIHTAEVVVGNFGSVERLNYTIIGDGVNLASRLEGVNKAFGTQILISQNTYDLVKDDFETRRIGLLSVKGREQPCLAYELIGPNGTADESRLAATRHYESGLDHYLEREWEQAVADFERVIELYPDDVAAQRLLAGSRTLLADPPDADWTGVFAMDGK